MSSKRDRNACSKGRIFSLCTVCAALPKCTCSAQDACSYLVLLFWCQRIPLACVRCKTRVQY